MASSSCNRNIHFRVRHWQQVAIRLFLLVLIVYDTDRATAGSSSNSAANPNPQIQQAITKCRDKLLEDPSFPKAQHLLGMLLESTRSVSDLEEIAELSYSAGSCEDRALEISKRIDALVRAGKTFVELGHNERAIDSYTRALTLTEDQDIAETILHRVTPLFFRGETAAILLDPHTSSFTAATTTILDTGATPSSFGLSDLASLLVGRFPSSHVIHQFVGAVCRKGGDTEGAFQSYLKAATISPPDLQAESYILAASAARKAGRDVEAQMKYLNLALEGASRQQLQEEPASDNDDDRNSSNMKAEVYNNMGIAYKTAGQKQQAIDSFQSALLERPGDGHALAQLASLGDSTTQTATAFDADYVQGLFDGYSARFEDELVNTLDYKGHEWVVQELLQQYEGTPIRSGADGGGATIVDTGCGTGLVGEALAAAMTGQWKNTKPNLIGVDLSPRMVEIAQVRTSSDDGSRIYHQVHQADAETFLQELDQQSVDAVVAADVFIYVGDLRGVFEACRRALKATGLLVFSVELTKEGMILLPSGRFGHSKKYIEDLAKQTGFDLKVWKEGTLRKQHLAPVKGAVVVIQKKG